MTVVPARKPINPNIAIAIFFTIIQNVMFSWKTSISRRGGKMIAMVELAMAPTREIIRSKCGTSMAMITEKIDSMDICK